MALSTVFLQLSICTLAFYSNANNFFFGHEKHHFRETSLRVIKTDVSSLLFFRQSLVKNPFVAPEATGATAAAGGSNRRASSLMFIRTHTASEDEWEASHSRFLRLLFTFQLQCVRVFYISDLLQTADWPKDQWVCVSWMFVFIYMYI